MVHDLDQIREIFAGTPLDRSALTSIPLMWSDHDRIEISLDGTDLAIFDAWKIARSQLDETGRWPIALEGDFEDVADDDPNAGYRNIVSAATISDRDLLARFQERRRTSAVDDDRIDNELRHLEGLHGKAPDLEEVRSILPREATVVDLERVLFDWELRNVEEHPNDPKHMGALGRDFIESPPGLSLSLLPVAEGWHVPALLSFFDYEESSDVLAASLRFLSEQFGAEIWVHDYVVMLFDVKHPPATPEAAFEVALLHEDITGDGLWAYSTHTYRSHARELLGSNYWTLMTKP